MSASARHSGLLPTAGSPRRLFVALEGLHKLHADLAGVAIVAGFGVHAKTIGIQGRNNASCTRRDRALYYLYASQPYE